MKMNRGNFGELMIPYHKKVFFKTWTGLEKQYPKIATVYDMTKPEDTFPHIGDYQMWQSNTEGNTINETSITEGDTAALVAERFDEGYSVTWELVRDDQYDVFSGMGTNGSASGLAYGLQARIETDIADIVNTGFANTGYDGVALFSDSHPLYDSNALGDNLIVGALTPGNLKDGMTLMRQQKNNANLLIAMKAKQLVVGPDLEWTSKEITKAINQAYEMSNTPNVIEGVTPVVMDYITGTKWILRDTNPQFQNITLGWRDKVSFDKEKIPKTVDWFYYGYTRYSKGYVSWRGLVGSAG